MMVHRKKNGKEEKKIQKIIRKEVIRLDVLFRCKPKCNPFEHPVPNAKQKSAVENGQN